MEDRPLGFVIMPFSKTATHSEADWSEVFEEVFRPALEEAGYRCERARPTAGSLIGSILATLRSAPLVLADVTDRNANVFYELGVRHSLRRGTIVVSQRSEDVPSDLRGYWCLKYGLRPAEVTAFKREIARIAKELAANPKPSDNPVSDFLGIAEVGVSSALHSANLKKLMALKTELTGVLVELRRLSGENPRISFLDRPFLETDCLSLLLQTLYVDVGAELLRDAHVLKWHLKLLINGGGPELIAVAIEEVKQFAEKLDRLLEQLRAGIFAEPSQITSMVWMPTTEHERSPLGTQIVLGKPGSGKTMYCSVLQQALSARRCAASVRRLEDIVAEDDDPGVDDEDPRPPRK